MIPIRNISAVIIIVIALLFSTARAQSIKDVDSLCTVLIERGLYDSALTVLEEINPGEIRDPIDRADYLSNISSVHYYLGNLEESMDYAIESNKLYFASGDSSYIAAGYSQAAIMYDAVGQLDSAITNYERCIKIYTALDEIEDAASNIGFLSQVYVLMGKKVKAQKLAMQSLELQRKEGNQEGIADALSNLAAIYSDQGMFDEALERYEELITIYTELGLVGDLLSEYNNVGVMYQQMDDLKTARKYFQMSYDMASEFGDKLFAANAGANMGYILFELDSTNEAQYRFEQALDLFLEVEDKDGQSYSLFNLGKIALKQGDLRLALRQGLKALNLAIEIKILDRELQATDLLHQVYTELGEEENAKIMLDRHNILKDSVENLDMQLTIMQNEMVLKLQEKELKDSIDLAIERARNAQILEDEKAIRNYTILALATIIALLGTFIFLFSERNKKKLAEAALDQKEQLVKAMIQGQEEERRRIARELHDGIGANLVASKLKIASGDAEGANDIISKSAESIRNLSHELLPPEIEQQSIKQTLESYVNTLRSSVPFELSLIVNGTFTDVAPEKKITLYRIVQEALSNIVHHANAKEASIQLLRDGDEVRLVIEDDGSGFDASHTADGIGLGNMRSRVEDFGGSLIIDSSKAAGTTISVTLSA